MPIKENTKVLQFLDGDYQQVLDKMELRMQALSEQLRFEDAMVVRDRGCDTPVAGRIQTDNYPTQRSRFLGD